MRVGLLTTSFPRSATDSAGSFVLGFARALTARGCQMHVLAPEPSQRIAPIQERDLTVTHVRYLRPRALQRTFYAAGAPENLARDPLAWLGPLPFALSLARHTRALRSSWDAIVSHWALPCGLIAGELREQRPHLAVLHSADVHALLRAPGRRLWARRIARAANGLWFVTPGHREQFLELLDPMTRAAARAASWATPMGIELPELGDRSRARQALGVTGFCALALGRLVPIKGLDVLLRACRGSDIQLLFAGAGPERGRLEAEARALGVRARFLGEVSGHEKSLLLTAADTLVVPSRVLADGRSEGVPVAMLEAMAHGLPIVASAVGGIEEVAREAGLLVPADRPEALAAALERAKIDLAWRVRAGARARQIAESLAWNRVIEPALAVLTGRGRGSEISPTP
ncbi:MAG TPA: glycosyltransferase [Polyangiales bacterium]|nr:glycosyltransferase [Polyangiales bacterium]